MKRQRGFTLVEMMIVVAIIAVLSALIIGISGRTYGASAKTFADQVNSTVTFGRTRAVASRKWHYVEFVNDATKYAGFCRGPCIIVWSWSNYGMTVPDPSKCNPPADHCWQLITTVLVPSGVSVWNAQTALDTATGLNPAQNLTLDFPIYFRPDGSAQNGATIFVADTDVKHPYRVLVYPVTGSSYARPNW